MKQKWLEPMQDLLIILLNHLAIMATALTILGVFGIEKSYIALWTGLIVVPILFYVIRKNVAGFAAFYALHLLIAGISVLCPGELLVKGLAVLFVVFHLIWSVKLKTTSESGKQGLLPPVFFIVLVGGMQSLGSFQKNDAGEIYYLVIVMVYVAAYFTYLFGVKYVRFIETNEKSDPNLPKKEIYHYGMKQIALFSIGTVLIMIPASNLDWFSGIMDKIGAVLIVLLKLIIKGVSTVIGDEDLKPIPEEIPEDVGTGTGMENNAIYVFILQILEKIFTVVAYVSMAVLFVVLLVQIYKFFRDNFLAIRKKKVQKVQSNQDIRENCEIETQKRRERSLFALWNHREKVRKIFRKKVLKNKIALIGDIHPKHLEYLTAKECCEKIEEEYLKNIYEKARYSEENITAEDVKMAKMKG